MKVLFLCNLIPDKFGAFEAFTVALGRELRKTGDELRMILAGEPAEKAARAFQESGICWDVIDGWDHGEGNVVPWAVVRGGQELIAKAKPDVVAVHFGNELPTARLIRRARRGPDDPVRWVWHQRQQIRAPHGIARLVNRMAILGRHCDHFVALYEGGRRSLMQRKIPEEKVSVIHNGVGSYERQKAPGWLRQELGLTPDTVLIVNVSALISRKRVDRTIEAVSTSNIQHPRFNVQVIVAGEGPEQLRLQRLAREQGVEAQMHFLGRRNDVREILAEADVFMLTSEAEASPLALIEAMAAGLPCVVTDAGSARELVDEGKTGFVLEQDDEQGLSEKLWQLVNDGDLRRSMGQAACQRWQERFTLDRMVEEHIKLYRSLACE